METIKLKKHNDKRIRSGHHWVFSNEIASISPKIDAPTLVRVQSADGTNFGTGMYNPHSLVAVRLLRCEAQHISSQFFYERIIRAAQYRTRLFPDETSYRLIFGESDQLPGLIIDRYGDYFAIQTLSAMMDCYKSEIVEALRTIFPGCKGIVEKNNSALRALEGLPLQESVLWSIEPEFPQLIVMQENGLLYGLTLLQGQKTGYFLDQKVNRKRIQELCGGLRVLDCFTNQGGFAFNAAMGGATRVLGLDSSESAITLCRRNISLNSLQNITFEKQEVFDYLQNKVALKRDTLTNKEYQGEWDCIILDPPAFTKSKKHIPVAKRGYAKINKMAMELLPSGGFLATGSCSHHISEELFFKIIREQAFILGRELRLVFYGSQSPCHPVLLGMPETRYLKFFIFEVL